MDGQKMEDFKINVKIKLSALWTALMFCFTYADILAHMRSDIIEGILIGEIGGVQITQEALIGSAILMVFPIVMIFISLMLNAKVNRWLNIVLGAIYAGINLITMLMTGGGWTYYYIFAVVEVAISVIIVWVAWKWK
jgi:hypothetical protein